MKNSDCKLTATVEGEEIVIRYGLDRLVNSAKMFSLGEDGESLVQMTDVKTFAAAVAEKLLEEEEDGDTPIDLMLDEAIEAAIEDGADGIEIDE